MLEYCIAAKTILNLITLQQQGINIYQLPELPKVMATIKNVQRLEEIKETYGFEANAIVSMADVIEHLYNKEYNGNVLINDELKAAIDAYYAEYGV